MVFHPATVCTLALFGLAACSPSTSQSPTSEPVASPSVPTPRSIDARAAGGDAAAVGYAPNPPYVGASSFPPPVTQPTSDPLPAGVRCRIGAERFHRPSPLAVAWSGEQLVVTTTDGWDVLDGARGGLVARHRPAGTVGELASSGRFATFESRDYAHRPLEVIDLATEAIVASAELDHQLVRGLEVIADDASRFVGRSAPNCLDVLDQALVVREQCVPGAYTAVTMAADGSRIAALVAGKVRVLDGATLQLVTELTPQHPPGPQRGHPLAISPHGEVVAIAEGDQLRVVELATKHETVLALPLADPVAFSPRGDRLLATSLHDSAVQLSVWDVASGKQLWQHADLPLAPISIRQEVAWSADGTRVAYVANDVVRVVDATTGGDLGGPPALVGLVTAAISDDATLAVTVSRGWITVWDAATCAVVRAIPQHDVTAIGFAGTSHDLLAFRSDAIISISADGTVREAAAIRDGSISTWAASRDGATVALALNLGQRSAFAIWDRARLKEQRRVITPTAVDGLAFGDRDLYASRPKGSTSEGFNALGHLVFTASAPAWSMRAPIAIDTDAPPRALLVLERGLKLAINQRVTVRASGQHATLDVVPWQISAGGQVGVLGSAAGYFAWKLDEPIPATHAAIAPAGAWPADKPFEPGPVTALERGRPDEGSPVGVANDGTILWCTRSICDLITSP